MVMTIRSAAMVAACLLVLGGNLFFHLINHWLAAAIAVVAAICAAIIVDRIFINRAHKEMARLYGKDWR